jgi:hypothetical protein
MKTEKKSELSLVAYNELYTYAYLAGERFSYIISKKLAYFPGDLPLI